MESMLSYNLACEPLEPVKTQKMANAVKFIVAAFDFPLILTEAFLPSII